MDDITFNYSQHGPFTDPGSYVNLYADLPADLEGLCGVVIGLMVHELWISMGKLPMSDTRHKETDLRSMQSKLKQIMHMDPRPLIAPRPFQDRLYSNGRDQSLMLCSFLRAAGVPARLRTGFMAYVGNKKLDHAICQVWLTSEQRWVSVDIQMENMRRENHRLSQQAVQHLATLTPLDTPAANFITAAQAWLVCRSGKDDPLNYGITGDLWGEFMIRRSLLRDLLALNKLELIPWDEITDSLLDQDRGLITDPTNIAYLDRVAQTLLRPDANFHEIQRLYFQADTLRLPLSWYDV